MKDLLYQRFHSYISRNNPELIINLHPGMTVKTYITGKISQIQKELDQWERTRVPHQKIIEQAMELLTKELRPSKFQYLKTLLEQEFTGDYLQLREAGTLTTELVNLITVCTPVFKALGFTEQTKDNRILRYAITGQIREYLMATR